MTALHVTFRVGNADYALPAIDVLHLESFDSATPVPGAAPHVAGLVQTRGRLVPVVDLRRRFGLPPIEHSIDRRVVVVQLKNRIAGLLVDSAREVMQLDETRFEKPPEVMEMNQSAQYVRAVATVANRLLLLVDVSRVLGEEQP